MKKKDDNWQFYVNSRALGKATIPDRFLILAIDELLNEVAIMLFFKGLYLGYHQI